MTSEENMKVTLVDQHKLDESSESDKKVVDAASKVQG